MPRPLTHTHTHVFIQISSLKNKKQVLPASSHTSLCLSLASSRLQVVVYFEKLSVIWMSLGFIVCLPLTPPPTRLD